jgi:hypothetical protein
MTLRRRQHRSPRVEFRGELVAPEGFDSLVAVGVSLGGPVAIWASPQGEAELHAFHEQPGWGRTFPRTRPITRPAVAMTSYADSSEPTRVVRVHGLPIAHPLVDVLADGSFLVVGSRCRWTDAGPELNALAIDQNGRIQRSGCLGDGIRHLQVAADGTIWTGYFDEGVLGNLGWGGPGPEPLGAGGIAAWSPRFEQLWELDPAAGVVFDWYALNVSGDEVLACPYTDFPVVRIRNREWRVYPTHDVPGPAGIIASGDRIGLIGSYDDPGLLTTGAIENGTFHEHERSHICTPDGAPLPRSEVHCHGSVAHFIEGRSWYSLDLNSLL